MITVKIIKEGFGHKPGQVLTLTEFDAGRLLAFDFAETYTVPKVTPIIETQMVSAPEVREMATQDTIEIKIEPETKNHGIFKRRGRRPKNP